MNFVKDNEEYLLVTDTELMTLNHDIRDALNGINALAYRTGRYVDDPEAADMLNKISELVFEIADKLYGTSTKFYERRVYTIR